MTDFQVKLQEYREMQTQLRALLRQHGEQLIQAVFEEVFALDGGINFVMTRGSTPQWNDGDECTHSSEMFTGVQRQGYNNRVYRDYESYDLGDRFTDEDGEFVNSEADNQNLANATSLLWEFDDLFQDVYGTNYEVVGRRNSSGQIVVEAEEYECGY